MTAVAPDSRTAESPRGLTEPPKFHPELEFIEPTQPHGRWTIHNPTTGGYLRLGTAAADFLASLDGTRTYEALRSQPPTAMTAESVDAILKSFASANLLTTAEAPVARPDSRLTFKPPFVFQFTLIRRPAWLGPGSYAARLAGARVTPVLALLVAFVGFLALLRNGVVMVDALREPLALSWTFVLIPALLLVLNCLHEMAHGAALGAHGGTPRRLGIMLFYFSPAMFCDVTDAWRLRDVPARTGVLLAGPLLHAFAGGLLGLIASGASGDLQLALLVSASLSFFFVVTNLVPFIKLDGYFALVSWLDLPNLRAKALDDLRGTLAWTLCGADRPTLKLHPAWAVFALGAVALPALLVLRFSHNLREIFLVFGRTGAICIAMCWFVLLRALMQGAKRIWSHGTNPSRVRVALSIVVLTGGLVTGLSLVSVTPTSRAAVTTTVDGNLAVAFQNLATTRQPEVGAVGRVTTGGIFPQRHDGVTITITGPGEAATVSGESFLPIRGFITGDVAATTWPVELDAPDDGLAANVLHDAAARIELPSESVAEYVWDFMVGSTIRAAQCDWFVCS